MRTCVRAGACVSNSTKEEPDLARLELLKCESDTSEWGGRTGFIASRTNRDCILKTLSEIYIPSIRCHLAGDTDLCEVPIVHIKVARFQCNLCIM